MISPARVTDEPFPKAIGIISSYFSEIFFISASNASQVSKSVGLKKYRRLKYTPRASYQSGTPVTYSCVSSSSLETTRSSQKTGLNRTVKSLGAMSSGESASTCF